MWSCFCLDLPLDDAGFDHRVFGGWVGPFTTVWTWWLETNPIIQTLFAENTFASGTEITQPQFEIRRQMPASHRKQRPAATGTGD